MKTIKMVEVNYSGKQKDFDTIDEAVEFANELITMRAGSDIWVNGMLYQTRIFNYWEGTTELTQH